MANSSGSYTAMSGNVDVVANGAYRIKYSVVNGSSEKTGYIYVNYNRDILTPSI